MLEHLIADDEPVVRKTHKAEGFKALNRASAVEIVSAQVTTADWLAELGLTEEQTTGEDERARARDAFGALIGGKSEQDQINAVTQITTPPAVRQLTAMLTAYDWEFVNQAKELRGFVVAKLIDEAETAQKSGDRIKALTALGKVTEVGLFTEKVEITKKDLSAEEIDKRIKEKLARFMGVEDVGSTVTDAQAKEAPPPPPANEEDA